MKAVFPIQAMPQIVGPPSTLTQPKHLPTLIGLTTVSSCRPFLTPSMNAWNPCHLRPYFDKIDTVTRQSSLFFSA